MTTATEVILTATEQRVVSVSLFSEQTRATASADRRIPFVIPTAQEYFWRFEWQDGERAASADLEAGRHRRFDSGDPTDAARWLATRNDPDAG